MDDWNGAVEELAVSYGGQPKPALMASRKHVAKFMIGCLQNPDQRFMIRAWL